MNCFCKSDFYGLNTARYFNLSVGDLESDIPKELSFLATLYSGWNSEKLTAEQYAEAEQRLSQFPVAALSKRIDNSSLLSLRKKLFDLKIHAMLMAILSRNYNITQDPQVKRSVK